MKFARRVRYLAVPDIDSVEPHIKAGIHPLEVQPHFRRFLIGGIVKFIHIRAARIVLRDIRRIKRKRIADIRILMSVISGHLPDPRNIHLRVRRDIISGLIERVLPRVNAAAVAEAPFPAQHLHTVRFLSAHNRILHAPGRRNVVRPGRHGVFVKHLQIFKIPWYYHVVLPVLFSSFSVCTL